MSATATEPQRGAAGPPRVAPGTREQIGTVNWLVARVIGLATGGPAPNVFTTLARHRRLFRPWLRFAGALMPRGDLPRADSELVILRVAWLCGCDYEWGHHERLAKAAGLDAGAVERVRSGGPEAAEWTPRQRMLLAVVDELHERRTLSDDRWAEVRAHLSETEAIELCMLAGHYEMLAMTLNALRVQPDAFGSGGPTFLARLAQARRRS